MLKPSGYKLNFLIGINQDTIAKVTFDQKETWFRIYLVGWIGFYTYQPLEQTMRRSSERKTLFSKKIK